MSPKTSKCAGNSSGVWVFLLLLVTSLLFSPCHRDECDRKKGWDVSCKKKREDSCPKHCPWQNVKMLQLQSLFLQARVACCAFVLRFHYGVIKKKGERADSCKPFVSHTISRLWHWKVLPSRHGKTAKLISFNNSWEACTARLNRVWHQIPESICLLKVPRQKR